MDPKVKKVANTHTTPVHPLDRAANLKKMWSSKPKKAAVAATATKPKPTNSY